MDNEHRPYAQRRLEELTKKHPEIKNISSRDLSRASQCLYLEDKDGSKALAEARKIGEEHKEVTRISQLTDINELYRLSQTGGEAQYIALQRYREVQRIQSIEHSKPSYILKTLFNGIFKAIFRIK